MNEQLQFLEHMNAVAKLGKEQNGTITREAVMKEIGNTPLNEAQWEVMGEFLFSRQILLEGYTPKEDQEEKPPYQFTVEEQNFMKYYEADLQQLPKKTEEEINALIDGQAEASELYNHLLPTIYELAKEFADGKEQLGDLVQEANLKAFTLLEGIHSVEELKKELRLTLKSYIAEGQEEALETNKIADKLNQLVEAVEALKEQSADYTMEDISTFLDIPTEEIQQLLKIAGEE